MIKLHIDLKTRPQKLPEFLQTLDKLLVELHREEGNLMYKYQQSEEDVTKVHLEAEWQNWENLENHLKGSFFSILLGAIRVLCETPVVKIEDDSEKNGSGSAKKILKRFTESEHHKQTNI
jgi:quinol monooxygenase YgiN